MSSVWTSYEGQAGTRPANSATLPQLGTNGAAAPKAAASSSSSAATASSTIGGNDFLTLLVTEMKNQDPTAATDPNAYVNQLVSINSLEQLISINQNLSTAMGGGATGTGTATSQAVAVPVSAQGHVPSVTSTLAKAPPTAGNLSIPADSGAAAAVTHALDGHGLRSGAHMSVHTPSVIPAF